MKATRNGAIAAAAIAVATFYACGDETSELPQDDGNPSAGAGAEGGDDTSGVGGDFTSSTGEGGSGGSCVDLDLEPELETQPADIVFIIDNSGSMGDEIDEIQANLNNNFASIIASSGIDYRVIMFTAHGGANDVGQPAAPVCITQPLSSLSTVDGDADGIPDACDEPPGNVDDQFYHFDVHLGGRSGTGVQSFDGMCLLLETLYGSDGGGYPDEWDLHPEGWIKFLREEAVKVFVMVTDDRTLCTPYHPMLEHIDEVSRELNDQSAIDQGEQAAMRFDSMLTTLAPQQFGTPDDRRYLWYSIVGVPPKMVMSEAYLPSEAILTTDGSCLGGDNQTNQAYAPNTASQALSIGTKGLRFPVCATGEYDTVFNAIADGVIKSTAVPCEFDLPIPDGGQEPDLNTLTIVYKPGDTMYPETELEKVDNMAACGVLDDAFWVDESVIPNRVHLCPGACDRIEDDPLAELGVRYQCGGID